MINKFNSGIHICFLSCFFACMNRNVRLLFIALVVLSSRLIFVDAGFGSEEDAWGYAVNAQLMEQSHTYEYARMPGHPVVEYVYSWLPVKEAWIFNICTALLSTIAVVFFFLILDRYRLQAVIGSLMLAFTPAFYIHSSDAMDYNWSLCFLLGSFYFLGKRWLLLSAFFLALATGCRITAAVAIVPFLYYLFLASESRKNIFQFLLLTLILVFLIYAPAIKHYGFSFFDYVNQFGYPPLIKSLYKASFGVWGTTGLLATGISIIVSAIEYFRKSYSSAYRPLISSIILLVFLFVILYFYEPHKSGYLIPVIPFVIVFILLFVKNVIHQIWICAMLIAGCFFAGINLADDNRSATPSDFAIIKTIHHQKVAFDLLSGSVTDDYKKRWARINYTNKVIDAAGRLEGKSVIISGYWLNNILIQVQGREKENILFKHYLNRDEMQKLSLEGFKIYYIKGQDKDNDRCYKENFTNEMAQLLNTDIRQ